MVIYIYQFYVSQVASIYIIFIKSDMVVVANIPVSFSLPWNIVRKLENIRIAKERLVRVLVCFCFVFVFSFL